MGRAIAWQVPPYTMSAPPSIRPGKRVLRQNVDEIGIPFTVRQYSSRSMMVSTRAVCPGSIGSSLPKRGARISAGAHLGFSKPSRAASFR